MYLLINGNKHSVSRRIVTKDTIKYLTVTPEVDAVEGVIQMYRDDGFLLSEDTAENFDRHTYSGTLLVLTNKPLQVVENPVAEVVNEPTAQEDIDALLIDHEYRLTMLELGLTE